MRGNTRGDDDRRGERRGIQRKREQRREDIREKTTEEDEESELDVGAYDDDMSTMEDEEEGDDSMDYHPAPSW